MTGIYPAVVELSGGNLVLVIVVGLIALGALGMAAMFRSEVLAAGEGTDNMKNIALAVQEGADAYLQRQFRTLAIFAALAFFALLALPADDMTVRIFRSVFFLLGAGFSATVGYLGMSLAVRANLRVAAAANTEGRDPAMHDRSPDRRHGRACSPSASASSAPASWCWPSRTKLPTVLEGFGFGAALLAMFMRVGGGIFTKAADVGADLVGKVEQNIPEDDPRNAATIADNVGDNVGDCAGMAADLFESYAVTLVAALILGSQAFGDKGLVYPLLIPAIGALTAVAGVYLTKPRAGENGLTTINRAFYLSAGIAARGQRGALLRLPAGQLRRLRERSGSRHGRRRRRPAVHCLCGGGHRHRDGRRHPGPHRLLHRHRVPAREGRRQDLAHRRRDGDPLRPRGRVRVGRLHHPGDRGGRLRRLPAGRRDGDRLAVRGSARGLRPADHRRRDRGHGHLRSGLRQRPGHRRDVGRREPGGRADPDRARRGRQHHQGDHQGHRDRDRSAGRDRAVRLLLHVGRRGGDRRGHALRRRHHRAELPGLQPRLSW